MSLITSKLSDLSREELYSFINQLKRQINCLETDLIKSQLFLKSYEKYFNYFNEINENISSNNEILVLIKRLKAIKQFNENSQKLSVNAFNRINCDQILNKTNVESNDIYNQFEGKTVESTKNNENRRHNYSKGSFVCQYEGCSAVFRLNSSLRLHSAQHSHQSNADNNQIEVFDENDCSLESPTNQITKNEVQSSDNLKEILNNNSNQFIVENISNLETNENIFEDNTSLDSKNNSNNIELEDNDSDFDVNDQQISDNSDQEWNESQLKIKSSKSQSLMCTTDDCSRSFNSYIGLLTHKGIVHRRKRNASSNVCSDKVFRCHFKDCSSVFTCPRYLRKHQLLVHSAQYLCDEDGCHFKTGSNYQFKQHRRFKHSNHVFRCDFEGCALTFENQDTFKRHMARHFGEFPCDVEGCQYISGSGRHLKRHQTTHSNEKPFKCSQKDCDKTFKTLLDMRAHLKTHPNIKESVFVCQHSDCGKVFWHKYAFDRHQTLYHSENCGPTHMCDHIGCGKQFRNKKHLKRHQNIHSEPTEGPFNCSYKDCGRSFDTKNGLKCHEARVHLNDGSIASYNSGAVFRCEWKDCSKLFFSRKNLRGHLAIHKGKYRCDWSGCQFSGGSAKALKSHKAIHLTETQFKCEINGCDKQFRSTKYRDWHHLRAHPNEFSDVPWIECQESECLFKTKSKEAIRKHIKKVHPPHTFACEWFGCEAVYKDNEKLKKHMNVHTGDKKFRCDWPGCDKMFLLDCSLRTHRGRHKKEYFECQLCNFRSTTVSKRDRHLKTHENQTNVSQN